MSLELSKKTKQDVRNLVEYFRTHEAAAGEAVLTQTILNLAANLKTIRLTAAVRFTATCRGCGKELLNISETTDVLAGVGAPVLVYSTGLDPHECDRLAGESTDFALTSRKPSVAAT